MIKITEVPDEQAKILLLEMANMPGAWMKREKINFSFYFSYKTGYAGDISHGIRAKIVWNENKMKDGDADGYMELFGDYCYIKSKSKEMPQAKDISKARTFFKKYKVLFAAVWENKLNACFVQDYFRQLCTLEDICAELGITQPVTDIKSLEKFVRKHGLFNMND